MSNQEQDQKLSSVTTTTEEAQQHDEDALQGLTPVEEKVVRMLHGMSEDDSRSLEFGLGADEEAKLKLVAIEQQLAQVMSGEGAVAGRDDDRQSPAELLSSWLDAE